MPRAGVCAGWGSRSPGTPTGSWRYPFSLCGWWFAGPRSAQAQTTDSAALERLACGGLIRNEECGWCSPPVATSQPRRSWRHGSAAVRWCCMNPMPSPARSPLGRFCTRVALAAAGGGLSERLPSGSHRHAGAGGLSQPAACPEWVPAGDGPLLLVIGGSQALGLNRMVRAAAPACSPGLPHRSPHRSRRSHQGQLQHRPIKAPFQDEIRRCFSTLISPSHALVLAASASWPFAEPSCVGSFPAGADDHQSANAAALLPLEPP